MQAKDIPDKAILKFLAAIPYPYTASHGRYARYDILSVCPANTPTKVALAKMAALIRRDLASGCTCGCRGDFSITDKGRVLLEAK